MNTLTNSELEDILADVEKHAVWYSKNKYNKSPVGHDIGMPKHVALERLQALINKQIIEARIDEANRTVHSLAHTLTHAKPHAKNGLRWAFDNAQNRLTQLKTTK